MLDGKGIDFESIGLAQGMRRAIDNIEHRAQVAILSWQQEAARHQAHAAGRHAQMGALLAALRDVDPDHPVLDETGMVWPCGTLTRAYETCYADAYDGVARARGIPLCSRPMAPADHAAAVVMAEPIRKSSFMLLWTRWHWRGDEYRSLVGAERARQREADLARGAA